MSFALDRMSRAFQSRNLQRDQRRREFICTAARGLFRHTHQLEHMYSYTLDTEGSARGEQATTRITEWDARAEGRPGQYCTPALHISSAQWDAPLFV